MLRKASEGRQLDFADFTRAARSVPRDHELLRMRELQTDAEIDQLFADAYDPAVGRPSYPPSQVFRISVLQFLFNLGDDRVVEEVGFNLLYREFVGLGWNDRVPDSSVLSRFRTRVGPQRIKRVLDDLINKGRAIGLLGDKRRVVDGTHIAAKVAKRTRRELCAEGRRYVLNALRRINPELAKDLKSRFPPVRSGEFGGPEARLEEERLRTAGFLAEIEGRKLGDDVADRARLLRRVALEANPDKLESFFDQGARFGHKTETWTFTGYKAHEEIDPKSRLITAVHVIPGNENEPSRIGELLDREPGGLPKGAAVIGDAAYTNEPCHKAIRDRGGEPVSPRMKVLRQIDKFTYDPVNDRLTCAAGKHSIARTRQDKGTLHQFSMKDCAGCPLRQDCLRPSELNGKANARARVWLGDTLKPKLAKGEAGSAFRKLCYAERYKVEGLFAEQKGPRSKLGFARYWGLVKVEIQALFTAIATDALRMVRWLARSSKEVPLALQPAA